MKRLKAYRQLTPYSCGAARVRSLIKYWENIDLPEKELREELHTQPGNGTYAEDIIKFFRKRGYKVTEKHGMSIRSLKYWLKRKVPILVGFSDHWWILYNMGLDDVFLMENEFHTMKITKFLKKWFDRDPDGFPYARYGIVIRKRG